MVLSVSNWGIQRASEIQIIILVILDNKYRMWLWSRLENVYLKYSLTVMQHIHSPLHTHAHILCSFHLFFTVTRARGQNLLRAEGKWLPYTWCANSANWESYQGRRKDLIVLQNGTWNQDPKVSMRTCIWDKQRFPWPFFSCLMEKTLKTKRHWCSSNFRVIWLELQ